MVTFLHIDRPDKGAIAINVEHISAIDLSRVLSRVDRIGIKKDLYMVGISLMGNDLVPVAYFKDYVSAKKFYTGLDYNLTPYKGDFNLRELVEYHCGMLDIDGEDET
jgi:hypothetical protein